MRDGCVPAAGCRSVPRTCQLLSDLGRVWCPFAISTPAQAVTSLLRANGVADLTRGGGPYACLRIGLASACPHEPDEGRREGSHVKSAAASVTAWSSAAPEFALRASPPASARP